jgi:hypothetical protein
MQGEAWEVWYLMYLVDGLWFAVAGAAYISDKLFLKWLTLTFYQEFVVNLTLRFLLSHDERVFGTLTDGYPLFQVQTIGSLVVFMLTTMKENPLDDAYKFIVLFVAPYFAIAVLLWFQAVTIGNVLFSLAIGGLNGFLKGWAYLNLVPKIAKLILKDLDESKE